MSTTLRPASIGDEAARDRLTRLFRFVRELNQIRNPVVRQVGEQPWRLRLQELPDHPSIEQGMRPGSASNDQEAGSGDDTFVLRVTRPSFTKPPALPDDLREWLHDGWSDPSKDVTVRSARNVPDGDGIGRVLRFEEDPVRLEKFHEWKARRDAWAALELPAHQVLAVYEELYELLGRLEREGERLELLLGDGILSWRLPSGGIYHPLLVQRVQLQFDPAVPAFTISETDQPVELYSSLLHQVPDLDQAILARVRTELEQGRFHPLERGETNGFLRRLAQSLSARGAFTEGRPQVESDDPVIGREPLLFLRRRTLGFATAIDRILEDLSTRRDLPRPLLSVVGALSEEDAAPSDSPAETVLPGEEPESILFSKPWNPEQVQIAHRLDHYGAVTVQGPPGTGKTHTIANLIGHLLATGQSVLITAHSTKALRVLRDQVVEPLLPLCISVLDNDLDSRRQLEDSVNRIVERLTTSDAGSLQTQAQRLAEQRRRLMGKLRDLRQRLMEARRSEHEEIVVAGQSYSPSQAARRLAEDGALHGWIPGAITPAAPLPLSVEEIHELYQTNLQVTADDERELSSPLPAIADLCPPDEFAKVCKQSAAADSADRGYRRDLWEREPTPGEADDLERLAAELKEAVAWLGERRPWELAAVGAGLKGSLDRQPWDRLLDEIQALDRLIAGSLEGRIQYAPEISTNEMPLDRQLEVFEALLRWLGDRERIQRLALWRRPAWRRAVRSARVSGRIPMKREELRAVRDALTIIRSRKQLTQRWDFLVARAGGPTAADLGAEWEHAGRQLIPVLKRCVEWATERFNARVARLKAASFRWEAFMAEQPPELAANGELLRLIRACLDVLPGILAARVQSAHRQSANLVQTQLRTALQRGSGTLWNADVARRLYHAVEQFDASAYRDAYARLQDLQARRPILERRREWLKRIEKAAPGWAAAVETRQEGHRQGDPPSDPERAWLWRQLHDELERRAAVSIDALQREMDTLRSDLEHTTARLIECRAWAAQIRRTSQAQRTALMGWMNTVKRMGKGYSKRAQQLRAQATEQIRTARGAIPVWIMPLSRVVEQFDPRATQFDVVIVDEASQADPLALTALYLGQRVVVVGDSEQVTPDAVGEDADRVDGLIREHLRGIPNAALYDGRRSIYDIALESFGGTIVLLEHFRCVPQIIQFSNRLSYNGRIRPLRDASRALRPHVIPLRVPAQPSRSLGKTNSEEALAIASCIAAAVEMKEYRDKTFGVIALVGADRDQPIEIEKLLRRHLSPSTYEARKILCGTAPQFQGDERDVVFLSMVDVPQDGPLRLLETEAFKRRYNVAASRARDQLWVVYSLDPDRDLKSGDLRKRLIEHALDPDASLRALEQEEGRTESPFERDVLRRLMARGYKVHAQFPVGYYRIDLVVEGGGRRLAIECDGDRYHTPDRLAEDMARQAVLERLGWRFVRIRGSVFYRDPDRAMQPVFERLDDLSIPSEDLTSDDTAASPEDGKGSALSHPLIQSILRRAAELQREWESPGPDGTGTATVPPVRPDSPRAAGDAEAQRDTLKRPDVASTPPHRVRSDDRSRPRPPAERPVPQYRWDDKKPADRVRAIPPEKWSNLSLWAHRRGLLTRGDDELLRTLIQRLRAGERIEPRTADQAWRLLRRCMTQGFDPDDPIQARGIGL